MNERETIIDTKSVMIDLIGAMSQGTKITNSSTLTKAAKLDDVYGNFISIYNSQIPDFINESQAVKELKNLKEELLKIKEQLIDNKIKIKRQNMEIERLTAFEEESFRLYKKYQK